MSQLRKDLVSGRWVIIASERSKRPDDFRPPQQELKQAAEQKLFCPFCEGNESKTPPEVFSFRKRGTKADQPGWRVRVVPNKFPALDSRSAAAQTTKRSLPIDARCGRPRGDYRKS